MRRARLHLALWLRRPAVPALAAGLALAAWTLAAGGAYGTRLMTVAGTYALMVIGYQLVFGRLGALSLAQGAFFGCGAYAAALLATRLGWGFAATLPVALVLPTLLAALIGAPVLRLQSHYFALATLGFAQIMLLLATNWQSLTGGANGIDGIPDIALAGLAVMPGRPLLALVWGGVAVGGLAAGQLARGPLGLAWAPLREAPLAAAAAGIDGARLRYAAFLIGALYAGGAGALYAHAVGVVSPDALGFPVMVSCLAMAVIGGPARIAGAIAGAVLLVALPAWLRGLAEARLLVYGMALMLVVALAPEGLAGLIESWWRRRLPLPAARPPPALVPAARAPAAPVLPPGAPLLEVRGLARRFGGIAALAGIDLDLAAGEILGIIGPNGSGKTTLVNLLSGFERPDAGTIRLAGATLRGLAAPELARNGVARTFQASQLAPGTSALDAVAGARLALAGELALGRALNPFAAARALARARGEAMHLLDRLGAAENALRPCGALAWGTRRRVEIARALALEPRVLLLDEPAAGLGEAELVDLAPRLASLAASGLALLIVEHNMPFLLGLAGRLLCLEAGRVIAAGPPAAVAGDPRVIEAYLGLAEISS